ncbi:PHD finger protein 7 [Drosophila biarmipes]|uniref:PHD finger protein 7 n=1 Tax=Drosophila biarmipes TaxID=125945 RepID=UPI0007E763AC|nr:PHD finger protein 7 [Drosophila biarmipes]
MVRMCVLCRSSEAKDEVSFGPTIVEYNIMVHRNCLYLSSNLVQRGNSRVGILRFLKDDIVAEARRCRHLICCYCHQPGANIGCCKFGCRRTFHTKCGIDNLAQNQFRGTYKSFCHQHVITHHRRPTSDDAICVICTEQLIEKGKRFNAVNMLYSPCCQNGWYHRRCLQKYANTSGYFFKCPLCNNTQEFHDVTLMGIAVSSQDAIWETEPNAYAEHFRRDIACVAKVCRAMAGRSDNSLSLIYCSTCGSNPSHAVCVSQVYCTYVCYVCLPVMPTPRSMAKSDNESVNSDESDFVPFAQESSNRRTPPMSENAAAMGNERDSVPSKLYTSGWDDSDDTGDDEEVFERLAQRTQHTVAESSDDEQPSTSAAAAAAAAARTQANRRRSTRSSAAAAAVAAPRRSSLRLSAQNNNQENTEPSGSSSSGARRSLRSRRTMPAKRFDSEEEDSDNDNTDKKKNKRRPKKRAVSPSPSAMPASRRYLRSMSPNFATARYLRSVTPEAVEARANNQTPQGITMRRMTMASSTASRSIAKTPPGNSMRRTSMTPEAVASRSNGQAPAGRNVRRRTMTSSNAARDMDVSCVANRTRNRLPSYMAHRK